MLQRAASNAYSWWWASHIRTKQSKWLEQCLEEMEEKVQRILTLIQEDGDSFAKRAEMYYRRRPELISSVQEAFKSFRALADRYDLLSKELQNANHTIATVFPEKVQFAMGEDEDYAALMKDEKNFPVPRPDMPPPTEGNMPQIPEPPPTSDFKKILSVAAGKQLKSTVSLEDEQNQELSSGQVKSDLTKDEALEEIKKLQKDILALQTAKEFVKSSYENGVAKYWEIENHIVEKQQRVLSLSGEFNVGTINEDDEARTLMAETALKSCEEILSILHAKQEQLTAEAREECARIEATCQQLRSLRQKYLQDQAGDDNKLTEGDKTIDAGEKSQIMTQLTKESKGTEPLSPEKSKDILDLGSATGLTVTQMAEKIDQLVNTVINLETAVSTQTALVNTLRSETDDLNAQIRTLEDEKETLINDANILTAWVKEMEEKLSQIQDLNKNVEIQDSNLQSEVAEASSNLHQLSGKLTSLKPDEEQEETDESYAENLDQLSGKLSIVKPDEEAEASIYSKDQLKKDEVKDHKEVPHVDERDQKVSHHPSEAEDADIKQVDLQVQGSNPSGTEPEQVENEIWKKDHVSITTNVEVRRKEERNEDLYWQQILLSGVEDRERILLKEYTAILRSYKDVKRKLNQMEKKEKDRQFDITLQMRELRKAILKRDEEIQYLRQSLDPQKEHSNVKEGDDSSLLSDPSAGKEALTVKEDVDKGDEIKSILISKIPPLTKVEGKLRADIDAILDENLDFWLRFSTAYHHVKKFRNEIEDLQNETSKLKEKRKPDGSCTSQVKSEARAISNHLREIQAELTVWLDRSVSLRDELGNRSGSLQSIQEDITKALKECAEEDDIKFSSLQAAKFQGEILNMKQENNKVREELQSCLSHVRILQLEIDKTIRQLTEEFGIGSEQSQNLSRPRVPLRAFIFGSKKRQKPSIFSLIHSSRRHQSLKSGVQNGNH